MKKTQSCFAFLILMLMSTTSHALSAPVDVDLIYLRNGTNIIYLNFSDKGAGLGCTYPGNSSALKVKSIV